MSTITGRNDRNPLSGAGAGRLATVGLFAMAWVQGCSGQPLQPWHTEKLQEEFTVEQVDEVRSLDDYRKLEDRLFKELEEKVYARVDTGPAYELVRFSAGSAADPLIRRPNWNRTFELKAAKPVGGVLLLHGMSDGPYSLRALAEHLQQHGYTVVGLRLPGHGTAPSGLQYISMEDMAAAVRMGMGYLGSALPDKPVHLVGYSNGATLALDFALEAMEGNVTPVPASLALISPSIRVHRAAGLAGFKDSLSAVPGLSRLSWLAVLPEFDPFNYNSFATNAGDVTHRLTRSVESRIIARAQKNPERVLPPVLVFKSTVDSTVTTEAVVDSLLKLLAPNRHELVLFDINRSAAKAKLLIDDPAPLTDRLMAEDALPFTVTFVTNENEESTAVVAHRKAPFSAAVSESMALGLSWPAGVISLSHVALPFPPDDPLYGQRPPENENLLFLGDLALRGERGLLKLDPEWLLRMRYNPFYDYIEERALRWLQDAEHSE
jgi:esterase/lipase